jgi:glucose dehydrogenase
MAGGVIFIAALLDDRLRAFNTDDGKFLWTATPGGDCLVAFSLP